MDDFRFLGYHYVCGARIYAYSPFPANIRSISAQEAVRTRDLVGEPVERRSAYHSRTLHLLSLSPSLNSSVTPLSSTYDSILVDVECNL